MSNSAPHKREMSSIVPVFVSLGSNIQPGRNLPLAVELLRDSSDVRVLKVSQVWESAPVGYSEQPVFCNAAALIETTLSPAQLKQRILRTIEATLQRIRDPLNKNGPRTIDLDISFYGSSIIEEPEFVIPDPEIELRPFLAIPLAELSSEFLHPQNGKTLAQIADQFADIHGLKLRPEISL